jgi:hypothetical protein
MGDTERDERLDEEMKRAIVDILGVRDEDEADYMMGAGV